VPQSSGDQRPVAAQRRAPVDPLKQHRQLRRAQGSRAAVRGCRPHEAALLKPLGEEIQPLTILPQYRHEPEHEGLAREGFALLKPAQRESAYRIAAASLLFWLDKREFVAQP
jgi:hypothetical protein